MAILTRSGRAALAAAIKAQPLHIALGEGNPDWDTTKSGAFTFTSDTLVLPHHGLSAVSVTSPGYVPGTVDEAGNPVTPPEGTLYAAGVDYTLDAAAGTLIRLAGGAIVAGAQIHATYRVDRPAEDPAATALRAEVGRRLVEEVAFVTPDPDGGIVVPTGRYAVSTNPTQHLFVRVRFDFADAATVTVREQALFVGSLTDPALPAGQRYFSAAEVVEPGILLLLQHSVPIVRQPSTRETFEFVVTF
ncbi:hypothetical protein ACIU1J_02170 [Azospirillum doebereinerae]|uniref:hypothetical protein n=1 Tax=Azospirillum doebereinerae TaxID=92933 RepID=UPI001EE54331|nr:hypothetical protein [Azospirillum doebereinerae]MCG5240443.1 hypothetical protein [Azospirillum doebereinerae]